MAAGVLDDLEPDHVDWLLVAANNYLCQRRPDRATALLELADLLDPDNLQCQKMLAYAYWLQNDPARCAETIERVLSQPLGEPDRVAMEIMRLRLGADGAAAMAPAAGEERRQPGSGRGPA